MNCDIFVHSCTVFSILLYLPATQINVRKYKKKQDDVLTLGFAIGNSKREESKLQ